MSHESGQASRSNWELPLGQIRETNYSLDENHAENFSLWWTASWRDEPNEFEVIKGSVVRALCDGIDLDLSTLSIESNCFFWLHVIGAKQSHLTDDTWAVTQRDVSEMSTCYKKVMISVPLEVECTLLRPDNGQFINASSIRLSHFTNDSLSLSIVGNMDVARARRHRCHTNEWRNDSKFDTFVWTMQLLNFRFGSITFVPFINHSLALCLSSSNIATPTVDYYHESPCSVRPSTAFKSNIKRHRKKNRRTTAESGKRRDKSINTKTCLESSIGVAGPARLVFLSFFC